MANPLAFNDQTGEALRFENGAWLKTDVVVNDQTGERMAFDGVGWSPLGKTGTVAERSPDPANTLPVQPSIPDTTPRAPGLPPSIGRSDNETVDPNESTGNAIMRQGAKALDYVGGVVDQTGRGVAQGVAGVVGLPSDALNLDIQLSKRLGLPLTAASAVARLLGINEVTVGSSGELNKGLDQANRATAKALGVDPPREQPRNTVERFGNRIGQELGFLSVPAGAAASKARTLGLRGARELANGGSAVERVFGGMVEKAAVDPKKFIKDEVRTGVVAGTGGQAGRELVDPEHKGGVAADLADLAGSFGLVGARAAKDIVGGRVKDIGSAVFNRGEFMSDAVKRGVTDKLLSAYGLEGKAIDSQELIDVIRRSMDPNNVESSINGFKPTLSYVTNSPGIAALERGQQSGSFMKRQLENRAAVGAELEKNAPQTPPGEFRSQLEGKRDALVGDAAGRAQAAQQAFDDAVAKLQPGMNAEGRGANIRGALEDALQKARDVEKEAWAPINQSKAPVDMADLDRRFTAVSDSLSEAERTAFQPTTITDIPKRLIASGGATPMTEATGIRSTLASDLRAAKQAGDVNKARIIEKYIAAVDGHIEASVPPELRDAYAKARSTSANLNDRFNRQGTEVARVTQPQAGPYAQRVADSPTSRNFARSRPDTEALLREAGDSPKVQAALRDQTVEDLIRGNNLANPAKTERFVHERGGVMDHLPALRDEIRGASAKGAAAAEATAKYEALRKDLGDNTMAGRSAVAKYLKYGNERAADAIAGVVNSPKPGQTMDELLAFVGNDKAALDGARKAYWEYAAKRGRAGVADFAGADPGHRAVVERLYRDDPEQLKRVDQLLHIMHKLPVPSGVPLGMVDEGISAPSMASIAAAAWAAERGVVSPGFSALYLAGKTGRGTLKNAKEAAMARLEAKALADPEFAAALLAENNPANRAALRRGARGWLGSEASTLLDLVDRLEGGKKDPVVDAATRSGKADKQGR